MYGHLLVGNPTGTPSIPAMSILWRKNLSPAAVAFLLPNFLGFCLFTVFPVILSFGMAFTNWSLKPAIPLRFVGLRNFTDLLWVQAHDQGAPGVSGTYFLCALLLIAGGVLILQSITARWRGLRVAGWLVSALALAVLVAAVARGAHHSFYVLVALGLGLGWLCRRAAPEGEGLVLGTAVLPPVILALAVIGLWVLHRPMWTAYEPADSRFWYYLYNTFYLMLALPVAVTGSLMLALLLSDHLPIAAARRRAGVLVCVGAGMVTLAALWLAGWRDAGLLGLVAWLVAALGAAFNVVAFRTIFYLPSFTSGVALMILWKALFNPQTGPINALLGAVTHLPTSDLPQWLGSIATAKPALMIIGVWTGIGGTGMLLYLAALSNVSPELLEAADIDGASKWQRFAHIIWPQILPTTFFIGITSIIGGLQGGFEQARVMTNGGPAGATTTLSYYIYTLGFEDLNFGYAAALSWVLFAVIFGLTALNWRFGRDLET